MPHQILLLTLGLLVAQAAAGGCRTDSDGIERCDGISWTARIWIYVGAAILLMIFTGISLRYYRRHLRKKRERLPAAKGAIAYRVGEYEQQRQAHLPGYKPNGPILPVTIADNDLRAPPVQTAARSLRPVSIQPPPTAARFASRSSHQPPPNYYESTAMDAAVTPAQPHSLRHAASETTLADHNVAGDASPGGSIARTGPALPVYTRSREAK